LKNNAHIVKLLGSFTSKGYHHLIFPHADDTLQSYWQRVEKPWLDPDQWKTVLWVAQQCKAIADGLSAIHDYKTDNLYGRHGDIKPANILWFRDEDSGDPDTTGGVLKISDFGLARFHKLESRSKVDPASISGSPTYMPPECELHSPVSKAYDIWSLGCLYLEFITWLVCGWEGVEEFAHVRSVKIGVGDLLDDKFYTVLGYKVNKARSAVLRPSVTRWIEKLRKDPLSTPSIIDFLKLVQDSLLVPDPQHRMGAKDIVGVLSKMLERARFDPGYISTVHHRHTSRANDPTDDPRKRPLRTVRVRTRERKETHQNRSI
jgi:serine/threonine protein kinase